MPQLRGVGLMHCMTRRGILSCGCFMGVFWLMAMVGIFLGNLDDDLVGVMVDGYLGWYALRDTLGYGTGDMVTLGTVTGVGSIVYGTGGETLRDGTCSGTFEGARLGELLGVVGSMGVNCRIGKYGFWVQQWSRCKFWLTALFSALPYDRGGFVVGGGCST